MMKKLKRICKNVTRMQHQPKACDSASVTGLVSRYLFSHTAIDVPNHSLLNHFIQRDTWTWFS